MLSLDWPDGSMAADEAPRERGSRTLKRVYEAQQVAARRETWEAARRERIAEKHRKVEARQAERREREWTLAAARARRRAATVA